MTNLNFKSIILTLVTLLTLGVGEMWANNTSSTFYLAVDAATIGSDCGTVQFCIKYSGSDWTSWTSMTKQDATYNGKLVYKATYTFPWDGYHNWQWIWGGTMKKEWYAGSWNTDLKNGKIFVYDTDTWETYSADASYTVYYVNANSWTAANVKAYAWNGDGCDKSATWAGTAMTSTGKKYGGKDIYSITFSKRFAKIIFSNNGADTNKTDDLTLGTTNAGKMFTHASSSTAWVALQHDVTLDQQSGSGGTSTIIATPGSSKPSIASLPTRTGYDFGGYYTSTGGGGTQYYNASGTATSGNWPAFASSPATLYAKWTKKTFTVTVNNDGHGSTSPSGAQSSIAQVDGVAISASADDDYEFVNWTITNGTGSFTSATSSSTRFYPTSTATIQANFRSTLTYSLTVAAGSNVGTVTGSTDPVTLGSSYAITASNFTSGYEFNNWTASPAANATFASSTSASTNVTVKNGSVTVTANAREIMRNITISGGTVYGGAATSTTAGVATSAKITANAPAAGKKFTGWTLGSGVSLKGGYSLTDRTIEIYSTANATVTANFADRAGVKVYFAKPSGWSTAYVYAWKSDDDSKKNATWPGISMASTETINYITYYTYQYYTEGDGIGGAATGNSAWDNIKFTDNGDDDKRTADLAISSGHYYFASSAKDGSGKSTAPTSAWCVKGAWNDWSEDADQITHSAAATGSKSITLSIGNKEFKIYNIVEQTWWRFSGNVTATKAATTIANNIDGNITITPSVAGPYTFALAGLTGTPTLAITYPTSYTVTFNAETFVNGGASHSTSTTGGTLSAVDGNSAALSSGGKVISGGTAVITASKKTGYSFIGFYTNAACTTAVSGAGVSISDNVLTYTGISGNKTVYAKFSENMTTVNLVASPTGKGTFSNGVSTVTSVSAGVTTKPAVTAVAGTGYRVNTSATVWAKSNSNITLSSTTANPVTVTGCGTGSTSSNLTATFTPKTYTITLHEQGATTHGTPGDGGTITATFDATTNLSKITAVPERTGYTFGGYYDTEECDGTWIIKTDTYFNWDGTYLNSTTGVWKYDGNVDLYAKWTANKYTVTLDVDEANKGTTTGATTSQDIYYDDATVTVPNLPTAAQGYGLDGYYTEQLGEGTKVIDGDGKWIASVAGYTDASKHWIHAGDVTLYAYYKKAEITAITLSAATVAPSTTVTATPTISPTPAGTTKICWKILRDNGNLYTDEGFTPGVGNAVSFSAPSVSGSYKVACVLRTGSTCGSGDVLDSTVTSLVVAGEHTVTIQYQDGDGRTLKDTIHITGKPLEWTTLGDITPPTITGYTFARWEAGDGITIKNGDSDPVTTTTTSSIQIKAIYDGTLTAVYTKKRMIYFYNNLDWGSVYVYFYKNDTYWENTDDKRGTGANTGYTWTDTPYELGKHGQMLPVSEGSNIYYFDAEAEGVPSNYDDVVFTEHQQHGYDYFYETNAVRRGDYKTSMPMFVPLADQDADVHNKTNYYNNGYWMNYPENSGYTLKIYNDAYATKETAAVQSIAFPYSEDLKLPLKLDVELTDGYQHDYWFMIYRNDNIYMGSAYHFKQGYQAEQTITGGNTKNKITTSAPGKYKFTLTYHDNGSGTVNYYIDVDFPIATGDYRIVYTDNATWSQGAHGASWNHPSDIISKAVDAKKDTVSFFVSKGESITPAMKFQKASVTNEGVVTWSDVDGGSITIPSSITTSGVYNFIVSQPEGGASISLEKVEPYTGNFYIRTDCAGNTKWDSFKNIDHLMTYSEFAKDNSGFTHYYAHWVTTGQNVKFTIANDYSMCISDTLIGDYGTAIADIDGVGILESGNASIRFMWNQATNKISRAYIAGSSDISDRFLVLEGDSRLFDENGDAYSISGLDVNEVNLIDDQNFVYERIIKVQPGAQAKLTAKYNGNVQYFQGGSGSTSADSIILLGGKASVEKYDMRIVYDFKTNRLIRAYQPSGTIDDSLAINADMMIVREHQDAGNQLTFGNNAKAQLSEVKTVYGVMRFNRWTLNNKSTAEGHSALPVSEQKSSIWRGLYWISFPFDVNLSDVFGFGTYGTDWIIMYYDGARRAKEGYWADSKSFWTYIWNRRNVTLKAGEGYVLALELPNMKDDNIEFWNNNIEQIELFFPSADAVNNIKKTNVDITVASHECTIDRRTDKSSGDANKDRTIADSHWNVIGVPSYANYGTTLKDGSGATITWNSNPATQGLPFLYEWNANDNTYTAQSGTTYNFKSMHSYIVQYTGTLRWLLASATPSSIVARRTYSEAPQSVEFRLELQQDDEFIDQTFVKMSNDEEVSAAFAFGEDMTKEFNGSKSNIYTLIENYLPTAGNTLPISESITIVPVGIKIKADGDYTFAIPDGTDGVGITLVDEETGIRTNLSLLNYNVYLEAGTYNNRFYLEISPVRKTPTSLEGTQSNDIDAKVRKVLINDILYIVKDGMIFDAHGARVQ